MSIQEIEQAIRTVPLDEARRLQRILDERLAAAEQRDSKPNDLRELAAAAGPYWQGGDGLEYQQRIRAEWDERPTLDR